MSVLSDLMEEAKAIEAKVAAALKGESEAEGETPPVEPEKGNSDLVGLESDPDPKAALIDPNPHVTVPPAEPEPVDPHTGDYQSVLPDAPRKRQYIPTSGQQIQKFLKAVSLGMKDAHYASEAEVDAFVLGK